MRSLPLESLAPVGVLFVAGALLLTFGRRLLKPVLVIGAVFFGVVLAVRVGDSLQLNLSPIVYSIIGAFTGIIAVVVSYRVALGLSVAAIGAVAAMLIATAAAESGFVDVGIASQEEVRATTAQPSATAQGSLASEATDEATDAAATGFAKGAVAAELDRVSPGLGPSFVAWIDRCSEFVSNVGTWTHGRWQALPRPMRTLLLAAGAAGAFLGFVMGIAAPVWAAATITSLLGSLLVLLCGVPLAARFVSPEAMPSLSPIGWLGAWLGLACAGWLFQWWSRPASKSKRAANEAEPESA